MALKAALFGLLAGSTLVFGALIGLFFNIQRRVIAVIMAFGAGVLISTLAFDLMGEAYKLGGFDSSSIGFV
ncbi:MAG: ZIP family zinc transporter, partial [Actinobacteria bacterium]|nr:ZIP family zinc transporter [Actinomycetota bacterium]